MKFSPNLESDYQADLAPEKIRVIQAIQAGVTDYLVEPFTPETLREKLNKHIAVTA